MNMRPDNKPISQELHHEIFGSILDRNQMTPYLLLKADTYETALRQATRASIPPASCSRWVIQGR